MWEYIWKRLGEKRQKFLRDNGAFWVYVAGSHLYLWYEACMVLPWYVMEARRNGTPEPRAWLHYAVAAVIYVNSYGNLYLVRSRCISWTREQLKLQTREQLKLQTAETTTEPGCKEWKHCKKCDETMPPRSHHCVICNVCILRRDHHCWFTACCIGLHNHRHFISILVYVFIAALYGNIFNWTYVGVQMGGHGVGTWLCIAVPHMAMMLGSITLFQLFIALMTFLGYAFLFMVTWLLCEQTFFMWNGQTKHENKKDNHIYSSDKAIENIREVLGDRWYLILLSPWIPSKLHVDGYVCVENP